MLRIGLIACAWLLTALQTCVAAEEACDGSEHLDYICGPANAEDLVQLPGTGWVLSSSMAPGDGIYLIDAGSRAWSALYTGRPEQVLHDAATYENCAEPPALEGLVTHGLHLRARGPRGQGRATLYVVGHGAREAIEVFDVATGSGRPEFTWRGCVRMPEGLGANSVTSLKDGTLLATVLMHPEHTFSDVFSGAVTGAVYRWSPGDPGFVRVPGSELSGNNGIEMSADETEVFVVSTGLATISVFTNTHPMRLVRTTPPMDFRPDNIHMAANGQLITAGPSNDDHNCGELDAETFELEDFAACPTGSVAATFDPQTLEETARWSSPPDTRFSNATMALKVGDEVWIGSFSGSRIGIITDVAD